MCCFVYFLFPESSTKNYTLRIDIFCCLKSFLFQHEMNQHDLYTEILEN